jgi:hypothetical protein
MHSSVIISSVIISLKAVRSPEAILGRSVIVSAAASLRFVSVLLNMGYYILKYDLFLQHNLETMADSTWD